MADPKSSESLDTLPMQKTSPVTFLIAGLAVMVVGGLVVLNMDHEDPKSHEAAVKEAEAEADATAMTKEEREAAKQARKEAEEQVSCPPADGFNAWLPIDIRLAICGRVSLRQLGPALG